MYVDPTRYIFNSFLINCFLFTYVRIYFENRHHIHILLYVCTYSHSSQFHNFHDPWSMIHEGRRWETARAVEIGLTTTAWTHLSSRTWRTNVSNTVRLLVLCASCLWCCSTRSRYLSRSYDPAISEKKTDVADTDDDDSLKRKTVEEERLCEEWRIVEEHAECVVLPVLPRSSS